MAKQKNTLGIPLPRRWPRCIKAAVLNVVSLAQFSLAYTQSWAVDSPIALVRLKAENDWLKQHVALLKEEIRIKNARMKRIDPNKRPHYAPTKRFSILELRAARAWSVRQAADVFHVTPATVIGGPTHPSVLPRRRARLES